MATRRRRTSRRRQPKLGVLSGIWFVLAAFFAFLTVVFESITLCVCCGVALLAAVIALFSPDAARIAAVPAQRPGTGNRPKPGVRRKNGLPRVSPGTPGTGAKRCGARCRRSIKPKVNCDCVCQGSAHGCEVGRTVAGSRAEATSKRLKEQERRHVKESEQWRRRG
jgi:hypothetical protein